MRIASLLCLVSMVACGENTYQPPSTPLAPTGAARCGDTICNGSETPVSCPNDCPDPCPAGTEGCLCRGTSCNAPLVCSLGLCISSDACPIGSDHCPCTGGGGCDPGLECVVDANLCIDPDSCPIGSDGCPCTLGGACDGELTCNQGICATGTPPYAFCSQGTRAVLDRDSDVLEADAWNIHTWKNPTAASAIEARVEWTSTSAWTLQAQIGQGLCPHNGITHGAPATSSTSPLSVSVTAAQAELAEFPASPFEPNMLTEIYAVRITALAGVGDLPYSVEVCLVP